MAIRPEEIQIISAATGQNNLNQATVAETEFLGSVNRLTCTLDEDEGTSILLEVSNNLMQELAIENGSQLLLQFPPDTIRVYPGKVANI